MPLPDSAYRVSTLNQIYRTIYYIVRRYKKGAIGYAPTKDVFGLRANSVGKMGFLGMSKKDAVSLAERLNKDAGWTTGMTCKTFQISVTP